MVYTPSFSGSGTVLFFTAGGMPFIMNVFDFFKLISKPKKTCKRNKRKLFRKMSNIDS